MRNKEPSVVTIRSIYHIHNYNLEIVGKLLYGLMNKKYIEFL